MSTARMTIRRTSQWINSGSAYTVLLDGQEQGSIADGQQLTLETEPGPHTVAIAIGRARSKPIQISLDEEGETELICGSRLTGWRRWLALYYTVLPITDLYIAEYRPDMRLIYPELTRDAVVQRGFLYFIWRIGIVGWGLPVGLFVYAVLMLLNLNDLTLKTAFMNLLSTMGIFVLGGIAFGLIMWPVIGRPKGDT